MSWKNSFHGLIKLSKATVFIVKEGFYAYQILCLDLYIPYSHGSMRASCLHTSRDALFPFGVLPFNWDNYPGRCVKTKSPHLCGVFFGHLNGLPSNGAYRAWAEEKICKLHAAWACEFPWPYTLAWSAFTDWVAWICPIDRIEGSDPPLVRRYTRGGILCHPGSVMQLNTNMINPKLKDSATDFTDYHRFLN